MTKGIRQVLDRMHEERAMLEALKKALDEAIASLEEASDSSGSITGELTVSDAIKVVLSEAERPLTVSEIRRRGTEQGFVLNPNTVRWSLRQATEAGKLRKLQSEDGRAKLYEFVAG